MELDLLIKRIIQCAYNVHMQLPAGFLESVYQKALLIELKKKGLHAEGEMPISVYYDDCIVGEYRADIVVENKVIVELKAVAQAVQIVKDGQGDFLMKGLCSTDKFLRAILNKETGLLPPKGTLTHCTTLEIPSYHKLLFVGDVAVIPAPDLKQKQIIMECLVRTAQAVGVQKPKVALIAATEQVLASQPATVDAALLAKMADRGQIKGCIADGPLALDVAIDQESVDIKGLVSPVAGDADCLLFPNIESGNVFYKANSKLVPGVRQAGILVGAKVPCVLSSRADSIDTKLNSIAVAAMSVK